MANKKSQAVMEFIFVYGWVIMIVLFSVGILWYLGLFNPITNNSLYSQKTCDSLCESQGQGCISFSKIDKEIICSNPIEFNKDNTTILLYTRYGLVEK